jgi:hypothetical protein
MNDGPGVPKPRKYGQGSWCSFDTTKQLIACNIIYLGEDEYMEQHKWYDGIIELLYGEMFPPYTENIIKELSESIGLDKKYLLHAGQYIIGECELLEVIQIIKDNRDIATDEKGFSRDGINLIMKNNDRK